MASSGPGAGVHPAPPGLDEAAADSGGGGGSAPQKRILRTRVSKPPPKHDESSSSSEGDSESEDDSGDDASRPPPVKKLRTAAGPVLARSGTPPARMTSKGAPHALPPPAGGTADDEGEDAESDEEDDDEDDGQLYCVCKQPYDASRFMIGCELCDDWYHGECINVTPEEGERIAKYVCEECRKKHPGKKTTFKPGYHRRPTAAEKAAAAAANDAAPGMVRGTRSSADGMSRRGRGRGRGRGGGRWGYASSPRRGAVSDDDSGSDDDGGGVSTRGPVRRQSALGPYTRYERAGLSRAYVGGGTLRRNRRLGGQDISISFPADEDDEFSESSDDTDIYLTSDDSEGDDNVCVCECDAAQRVATAPTAVKASAAAAAAMSSSAALAQNSDAPRSAVEPVVDEAAVAYTFECHCDCPCSAHARMIPMPGKAKPGSVVTAADASATAATGAAATSSGRKKRGRPVHCFRFANGHSTLPHRHAEALSQQRLRRTFLAEVERRVPFDFGLHLFGTPAVEAEWDATALAQAQAEAAKELSAERDAAAKAAAEPAVPEDAKPVLMARDVSSRERATLAHIKATRAQERDYARLLHMEAQKTKVECTLLRIEARKRRYQAGLAFAHRESLLLASRSWRPRRPIDAHSQKVQRLEARSRLQSESTLTAHSSSPTGVAPVPVPPMLMASTPRPEPVSSASVLSELQASRLLAGLEETGSTPRVSAAPPAAPGEEEAVPLADTLPPDWATGFVCAGCNGYVPSAVYAMHLDECADIATLTRPGSFKLTSGFRDSYNPFPFTDTSGVDRAVRTLPNHKYDALADTSLDAFPPAGTAPAAGQAPRRVYSVFHRHVDPTLRPAYVCPDLDADMAAGTASRVHVVVAADDALPRDGSQGMLSFAAAAKAKHVIRSGTKSPQGPGGKKAAALAAAAAAAYKSSRVCESSTSDPRLDVCGCPLSGSGADDGGDFAFSDDELSDGSAETRLADVGMEDDGESNSLKRLDPTVKSELDARAKRARGGAATPSALSSASPLSFCRRTRADCIDHICWPAVWSRHIARASFVHSRRLVLLCKEIDCVYSRIAERDEHRAHQQDLSVYQINMTAYANLQVSMQALTGQLQQEQLQAQEVAQQQQQQQAYEQQLAQQQWERQQQWEQEQAAQQQAVQQQALHAQLVYAAQQHQPTVYSDAPVHFDPQYQLQLQQQFEAQQQQQQQQQQRQQQLAAQAQAQAQFAAQQRQEQQQELMQRPLVQVNRNGCSGARPPGAAEPTPPAPDVVAAATRAVAAATAAAKAGALQEQNVPVERG